MGDDKIRISRDELDDPKVQEAVEQQLSFGMAGPREVEEKPTGLLYKPWFALMIAGALGAFLAWALTEPVFGDFVTFKGNVDFYDPGAVIPLDGARVEGVAEVGGATVWLIEDMTRVTVDGEKATADAIAEGQVVEVAAEIVTDERSQPIAVALGVDVLPAEAGRTYPPPDLEGPMFWSIAIGLTLFAIVAAFVGLFIGAADGVISRAPRRALVSGLIGFGVGAGLGLLANCVAGVFFGIGGIFVAEIDSGPAGKMSTSAFLVHMMVRGLAWAMAGAAAGLGMGIAMRSKKLFLNGLIGGTAGGLLGGLMFDPVDYLLQDDVAVRGAEVSRLVGITMVGACTGFMIGIVELLAREAWVKMLTGPLAGKEFILYRDPTTIGSSPKSDIFLFKDAEVEPTHALVHQAGEGYEIEDKRSAAGTYVNGHKVKRQRLRNGDQIKIGKTVLSFAMKDD